MEEFHVYSFLLLLPPELYSTIHFASFLFSGQRMLQKEAWLVVIHYLSLRKILHSEAFFEINMVIYVLVANQYKTSYFKELPDHCTLCKNYNEDHRIRIYLLNSGKIIFPTLWPIFFTFIQFLPHSLYIQYMYIYFTNSHCIFLQRYRRKQNVSYRKHLQFYEYLNASFQATIF